MEQWEASRKAEIEKLIYRDLGELARRAGLKDPRFGATQLIEKDLLPVPGSRRKKVDIYLALILRNIENVEPKGAREALQVKLNLLEGYPVSSSQERLGVLGRKRGRSIPEKGEEKGRSKQTENDASTGQKYLAILIYEELKRHSENDTWEELQGSVLSASDERDFDGADEPSHEPSVLARSRATTDAQTLGSGVRRAEYSRYDLTTSASPTRAEISAYPIAPSVLAALEKARQACEAANRKFVTPHLLLALLDLPNSQVAQCFNQAKPGLTNEWRELLETYIASDEAFGDHLEVDWNRRRDVWRSKELALHDGVQAVTDLYLLLGILDNPRSKTRRELEEYLGTEGYENLRRIAESMSEDTPGHRHG